MSLPPNIKFRKQTKLEIYLKRYIRKQRKIQELQTISWAYFIVGIISDDFGLKILCIMAFVLFQIIYLISDRK